MENRMSAHKLTIEIRHAAAERAATGGNTDSVDTPPAAPANTKHPVAKPPMHGTEKPNKNLGASEPTPPYAKENIGDKAFQAAEAAAMKKMHTALTKK